MEVAIDDSGRLIIKPEHETFPMIYREAVGVYWDQNKRILHSTIPRDWSYLEWYKHIIGLVQEGGVLLKINEDTMFFNIPGDLEKKILLYDSSLS